MNHKRHSDKVILTERQTAIIHLQVWLSPDPLPPDKVEGTIAQHLAVACAMKRLNQSYTRIIGQHLHVIHTTLGLADGHLGAQRCCLVDSFFHNLANL